MSDALPPDGTVDKRGVPPTQSGADPLTLPPTSPSVLAALETELRAVPRVHLGGLEDATVPPEVSAAPPPSVGGPQGDPLRRLRLLSEIARGGMGVVFRARDTDLGRELALKVLLQGHADKTEHVQRFIEEAQIAGQLQHPGVAPVHELGLLPDRRPYFTMKLVRGQTLATLLAERPRAEPGANATGAPADLPRFLKIFEQVCETLAYAHSKGVIHRDLKPSNVMVGAFGEVQVMDWGLAKVLTKGGAEPARGEEPEPDAASVIQTRRGDGPEDVLQTRAGSVLGTLAYMAPEQARGLVERLDERADVFGLGAILCEILTGKPPYDGDDAQQVHCMAVMADLGAAHARLDACGADAELLALARSCLAPEPAARPCDAGAVTAALTAYRESAEQRLRQAEVQRAQAEVQARAARKERRLALGLAAAVLGLVLFGGGGALWLQRQAAERRAAIEAALDQVTALERQERWPEAEALLDQAAARLGEGGPDELRQRLDQVRRDLTLVARLDAARFQASAVVGSRMDETGAAREYAAVFREAGLGEQGEDPEAVAARVRASAVRPQLVAALDDWALRAGKGALQTWILDVARRADPDPWKDRCRDPGVWQNRAALQRLAAEAPVGDLAPATLVFLASALRHRGGDRLRLLRAAVHRYPDDFWVHFELALALADAHQYPEAAGHYRAALALRPRASSVSSNLARTLREAGRLDEARVEYDRALRLDPQNIYAYNGLGIVLRLQGHMDEARAEHRKAIALDPRQPLSHVNLGLVFLEEGRLGEARAAFQEALRLNPRYSRAHHDLGICSVRENRLEEAGAAFRRAIALDPGDALPHNGLGSVLRDQHRWDEAAAEFRKAIRLDPTYADPHINLGHVLRDRGRLKAAEAEYREATRLSPRNPSSHFSLGVALHEQRRPDEALGEFRTTVALAPRDATAHRNLADVLAGLGRLDEAATAYHTALRLDPKSPAAHNGLGILLRRHGRLDEARAEYAKAIALDPKDPNPHNNLGNAWRDDGRFEEAGVEYQKAIRLRPTYARPHEGLGVVLRHQGRLQEARAEFRQAATLGLTAAATEAQECDRDLALRSRLPDLAAGRYQPAGQAERLALAALCQQPFERRYALATRLYADAFREDPKLADDMRQQVRYLAACAAALAAAGTDADAGTLDNRERARLRAQALGALRTDLAHWTRLAQGARSADRALAERTLRLWQRDPDLAGVRELAALAPLAADERAAWIKLWQQVTAVLQGMGTKKPA